MEDLMKHTLNNLNQLRHYGGKVKENPCSIEPIHIMTEDSSFNLELKMREQTIFADTYKILEKFWNVWVVSGVNSVEVV